MSALKAPALDDQKVSVDKEHKAQIADRLRQQMRDNAGWKVRFGDDLIDSPSGRQEVFLHQEANDFVLIDKKQKGGEKCTILWLPYKQGEVTCLTSYNVSKADAGTLFFTHNLSGCKLLSVAGGPVFHIDHNVTVKEFVPHIQTMEDIEDLGGLKGQSCAFVYSENSKPAVYSLADYGGSQCEEQATTYGKAGVAGECTVGGVLLESGQIELHLHQNVQQKESWKAIEYAVWG